ncbi:HAMP domain-containing histidine kinase [candidate division KSB1 bacterium]|nr:HAMP domain-containing histidine kinase [candidate division KSB1 bacterium]
MADKKPYLEIEKSLDDFNASISGIERAFGEISQKIEAFSLSESVPRDYLEEMAGNLAHEIRNPLGGIAALVELLAEESGKEQTRSIQGILEGIDRIDKVVENLIVFSKPVRLQTVDCNFCDILSRAVETARNQIEEEGGTHLLNLNVPEHDVFVRIDPVLMLQAVQNVLHNAIEVMPDGGVIDVLLVEDEDDVVVTIADQGLGFHGDNEEKPFYPFFTTKTYGMGLGLPTARLILEKHCGKIWLRNKPDKGAEVTLKLMKS